MRSLHQQLEGLSQPWVLVLAFALTGAVVLVDLRSGPDLSVTFLYMLPIWVAAWYGPVWAAAVFPVFGAFIGPVHEMLLYSRLDPAVALWNASMQLAFMLLLGLVLNRLRQENRFEHEMALRDQLTGLLNSRGFREYGRQALVEAQASGKPLALVFFDLDRFKEVNDRHGHSAGDGLLATVARTLVMSLRKGDPACRIGGDEFAVLLPGLPADQAQAMAERLREGVATACRAHGHPVTASLGVAVFQSPPPGGLDEMLALADQLMYEAKQAGKDAARVRVMAAAA